MDRRFGSFLAERGLRRYFCAVVKFNTMIRHLLTYLSAILLLTSCSAVKNAFQPKQSANASTSAEDKHEVQPEYKRVRTGSSTAGQQSTIFQTKDVASYSSSLEL